MIIYTSFDAAAKISVGIPLNTSVCLHKYKQINTNQVWILMNIMNIHLLPDFHLLSLL